MSHSVIERCCIVKNRSDAEKNVQKVAVITIHFGINYGSALQSYAMAKVLTDVGLSVKVINYIPERYSFKNIYFEKPGVVGKLKCLAVMPFRSKYQHIFSAFLKKNVPLTPQYHDISELEMHCSKYDAYFAGSDQIWNSYYNTRVDPAYFLSFAPKKAKKISYAASFGKSELEANEKEYTRHLLKNFNCISVREEQAKHIVNELGFVASHVLDPTMLIDKTEWSKLRTSHREMIHYVLVYALNHEEMTLINFARAIADTYSLRVKLISFSYTKQSIPGLDDYLTYQSPVDFVKLILEADYIVTNSFHGVAFSINLNKQFIAVRRKKYNSRLQSILKTFDLYDRMVEDDLPEELIKKRIDYVQCNKILAREREKSYGFIMDSMNLEGNAVNEK